MPGFDVETDRSKKIIADRQQAFDLIVKDAIPSETSINITYNDDRRGFASAQDINAQIEFEKIVPWFVKQKQALNILSDKRQGIISEYVTVSDEAGQSIPVYRRDARIQETSKQDLTGSADFENWAIIGLSYFQIAIQMVINANLAADIKSNLCQEIQARAQAFLLEMTKSEHPQALAYQTKETIIVPYVMDVLGIKTKEKASKTLDKLKDFVSLEEPPCALVTLIKVKGEGDDSNAKDFAEVDLPLYQLTKQQQIDYIKVLMHERKDSEIPDSLQSFMRDVTEPIELPEWYAAIKDEPTKLMIQHYAPQILMGRQIPTQMISLLPGLRNSGEERIYDLSTSQEVTQIPKQKIKTFHSGSIGQDTKASFEENVRLTIENMRQFQQLNGVKKIYVDSLISPMFYSFLSGVGNETRLHAVQAEAAKRINANQQEEYGFKVTYSNTQLAWTRLFYSADRTIENKILDDAKNTLSGFSGKSKKDIDVLIAQALTAHPDGISFEDAKKLLPLDLTTLSQAELTIVTKLKLLFNEELDRLKQENKNYKPNVQDIVKGVIIPANVSFKIKAEAICAFTLVSLPADAKLSLVDNPYIQSQREAAVTLFQHAVELERLRAISPARFLPGLQNNAQRLVKTKQMQSLLGELEGTPTSALITACKSGKDREGFLGILLMMAVVGQSFTNMSVQLSKGINKIGNIVSSVINAEHIATRAGGPGGSPGSKGIKNERPPVLAWLSATIFSMTPSWLSSDMVKKMEKKEAKSNKTLKADLGNVSEALQNINKFKNEEIIRVNGRIQLPAQAHLVTSVRSSVIDAKSLDLGHVLGEDPSRASVMAYAVDSTGSIEHELEIAKLKERILKAAETDAEKATALDKVLADLETEKKRIPDALVNDLKTIANSSKEAGACQFFKPEHMQKIHAHNEKMIENEANEGIETLILKA